MPSSDGPTPRTTTTLQGAATPPRVGRSGGARPGRVTSLDWARGLFLITSLVTSSVLAPRPAALGHAAWTGVTFYDLIFPLFVTLSGAGLAFAYRNRVRPWVTARRVVVLLVVGLAYNALTMADFSAATLRFTGPLQVYSVLVLVIALLHLVLRTARAWATATLIAAGALTWVLRSFAQGCPGGVLTPECNPSLTIDAPLLGAHMYVGGALGHDPEGLVAIAGALLSAAVGVTAGHLAVSYLHRPGGTARLLAWAATVAVIGLALAQVVEPMKRLWTPSFALTAGGLGAAILLLGYVIYDHQAGPRWTAVRRRLATPFVALGRNSLLVYFGSHLALALLLRAGTAEGGPSSAVQIADVVALDRIDPRLAFSLVWLAAWWLLALILHRFKIYVHA